MAKKTARNKSKAAPRRATKTRNTRRAAKKKVKPANTACYVTVSPPTVSIQRARPKSGHTAGPCEGFEQLKSATLDCLISAIEDAERQLTACKRAATIEQLRSP